MRFSIQQLAADNPGYTFLAATAAHTRGLVERDPAALEKATVWHRHPWVQATAMYLSRHTVDFHLRQAFRKLDVSSRVELTRLVLTRRDDSDAPVAD